MSVIIRDLKHTTTGDIALTTTKRLVGDEAPELKISSGSSLFSAGQYQEFYISKDNEKKISKELSSDVMKVISEYNTFKNDIGTINVNYKKTGQTLAVFSPNTTRTHFEYLFQHSYIGDTDSKYETSNIEYEYNRKYDLVQKFNTLYPLENNSASESVIDNYAYNIFRAGKGKELNLFEVGGDNPSKFVNKVNDGYIVMYKGKVYVTPHIKIEGCENTIKGFVIVRGIPIEMRRVETSQYTYIEDEQEKVKYNYIFSYPEYLLNDTSRLKSISMMIFSESAEGVFDGKTYNKLGYSSLLTDNYGDYLKNLNIIVRHNVGRIVGEHALCEKCGKCIDLYCDGTEVEKCTCEK